MAVQRTSLLLSPELMIISLGDEILLKPKEVFPETKLDEVTGYFKYQA